MAVASQRRVVLNLGSGSAPFPLADIYPSEEWQEVRVDADQDAVADVHADLVSLPFDDGYADAVVCMGVLEHFPEPSVPMVLGEMHRVLCPGGALNLLVPNMHAIAAEILEHGLTVPLVESPSGPISALDMIYGFSPMLAERPLWGHRTGFTADSLADWLSTTGFEGRVFTEPEMAPFMLLADAHKKGSG